MASEKTASRRSPTSESKTCRAHQVLPGKPQAVEAVIPRPTPHGFPEHGDRAEGHAGCDGHMEIGKVSSRPPRKGHGAAHGDGRPRSRSEPRLGLRDERGKPLAPSQAAYRLSPTMRSLVFAVPRLAGAAFVPACAGLAPSKASVTEARPVPAARLPGWKPMPRRAPAASP
jgi:hypothetical protein